MEYILKKKTFTENLSNTEVTKVDNHKNLSLDKKNLFTTSKSRRLWEISVSLSRSTIKRHIHVKTGCTKGTYH